MKELVNFKGSLCQHRFMVCQEGYCSDCAVHLFANELRKTEKLELVGMAKKPVRQLVASG